MERRRFIPTVDGLALESRTLLSGGVKAQAATAAAAAKAVAAPRVTNGSAGLPETIQTRLQRIQNLPFFLNSLQAGRYIDPDAMHAVQENLTLLITRLRPAPSAILNFFNQQLRTVGAHTSLSVKDANALSFAFNRVLLMAGGDAWIVTNLTSAMTTFARIDADSVNPTYLANNDYAIVLQLALGVGRPLSAPATPTLISTDRYNGQALVSKTPTPTLTGTYQPNSIITLRDAAGAVLGTAATLTNGQYSLKIAKPLPDGSYKLTVTALDSGFLSLPSRVFTLKINTPTKSAAVPRGPLSA